MAFARPKQQHTKAYVARALSTEEYFAALKVLMGQLSGAQSAEERSTIEKLTA